MIVADREASDFEATPILHNTAGRILGGEKHVKRTTDRFGKGE